MMPGKYQTVTKQNSKIVCPTEKARSALAQYLIPYVILAKKIGPGVSAPDAVTVTTIAINVNVSTQTKRLEKH